MIQATDETSPALSAVEREAQDWLLRFAAGDATAVELEAFERWSAADAAHKDAFAEACRVWDTLAPAADVLAMRRRQPVPQAQARLGRRAFIGAGLAAAAAGVAYLGARPPLGLWPSFSEWAADYRTGAGEQRHIALDGGPSIELNTRTSVAIQSTGSKAGRIELVAGEAAIATRATMTEAIEVIAGACRIAATDAVFNVRYDAGIARATCISGSVSVRAGVDLKHLAAGEQVVHSAQGLGAVAAVDPAVVTAWQKGVLIFHATPLADAIDEVNRYRPGRIILTNATLGRRAFSARFRLENIDEVVMQIQQVFGASVTRLPGGITLLG